MKKYRVLIFIEWVSPFDERIIKGSYYYYNNNEIKETMSESHTLRNECEYVTTFEKSRFLDN